MCRCFSNLFWLHTLFSIHLHLMSIKTEVMDNINRIKVVLVEQGRTGKWLAKQLGKDPSTVSKWCTNVIQPSLENLDKIATLLGVDRRELLNKST